MPDDVLKKAEALDRLIPSGMLRAIPSGIPKEVETSGDADLIGLADLAGDLRRRLSPRPAEAAQRQRVWARLAPHLEPSRRAGRVSLRPAYVLATLAVALFCALGTTTAYASGEALPGDPLYAVKRGLENARLALSVTEAGDAALLAMYADRRLGEIERLAGVGRWNDVEAAVTDYPDLAGLADLPPDEVEEQLTHHLEVLEQVRSRAPEAALAGLDRALERAARGRQDAERRRHGPKAIETPVVEGTPPAERGPKKTPPGLERKGGD